MREGEARGRRRLRGRAIILGTAYRALAPHGANTVGVLLEVVRNRRRGGSFLSFASSGGPLAALDHGKRKLRKRRKGKEKPSVVSVFGMEKQFEKERKEKGILSLLGLLGLSISRRKEEKENSVQGGAVKKEKRRHRRPLRRF